MKTVLILRGDGIGPEVTEQGVKVLRVMAAEGAIELELEEALIGAAALDAAASLGASASADLSAGLSGSAGMNADLSAALGLSAAANFNLLLRGAFNINLVAPNASLMLNLLYLSALKADLNGLMGTISADIGVNLQGWADLAAAVGAYRLMRRRSRP